MATAAWRAALSSRTLFRNFASSVKDRHSDIRRNFSLSSSFLRNHTASPFRLNIRYYGKKLTMHRLSEVRISPIQLKNSSGWDTSACQAKIKWPLSPEFFLFILFQISMIVISFSFCHVAATNNTSGDKPSILKHLQDDQTKSSLVKQIEEEQQKYEEEQKKKRETQWRRTKMSALVTGGMMTISFGWLLYVFGESLCLLLHCNNTLLLHKTYSN